MQPILDLDLQEMQLALLIVADWQIEQVAEDSYEAGEPWMVQAEPRQAIWVHTSVNSTFEAQHYEDEQVTEALVSCVATRKHPQGESVQKATVKLLFQGDETCISRRPSASWPKSRVDAMQTSYYCPPCISRIKGCEGWVECGCCHPSFTLQNTWTLPIKPVSLPNRSNLPDISTSRDRSILRQTLLDLQSRILEEPITYLALYSRDLISEEE